MGNRRVSRKIGYIFQVFSVKRLAGAVYFLRACSLGNEEEGEEFHRLLKEALKKESCFGKSSDTPHLYWGLPVSSGI